MGAPGSPSAARCRRPARLEQGAVRQVDRDGARAPRCDPSPSPRAPAESSPSRDRQRRPGADRGSPAGSGRRRAAVAEAIAPAEKRSAIRSAGRMPAGGVTLILPGSPFLDALAEDAIDAKLEAGKNELSRGHLSRPACSHVKQIAKEAGGETRPGCAAGFFVGDSHGQGEAQSKPTPKSKPLKPATTLVHGGILRSQFGENSEAIFLTQGYVYDSAEAAADRFKGEDSRLHLFALRQPDGRHVRGAHAPPRRRRRGAGDGERHGGGDRGRSSAI